MIKKFYNLFLVVNILLCVALLFLFVGSETPKYLDIYFTIFFIFDLGLNIFLAENKKSYLLSIKGVIDIISVFGNMLKVLRLLRLFKLDKEIKVLSAIYHTLKDKKEFLLELNLFLVITLLVCSYILMIFEPTTFETLASTLYYCIVCISTVGFGDMLATLPITRITTVIIILVGQSIFIIDLLLISNGIIKYRNIEVD